MASDRKASVTFDTAGYDEYRLEFVGKASADDGPKLRVSTDGGSTFVSTASYNWVAWSPPDGDETT